MALHGVNEPRRVLPLESHTPIGNREAGDVSLGLTLFRPHIPSKAPAAARSDQVLNRS
jgi:hypothetical protein